MHPAGEPTALRLGQRERGPLVAPCPTERGGIDGEREPPRRDLAIPSSKDAITLAELPEGPERCVLPVDVDGDAVRP